LNWQLLSVLRRNELESVWERASIEARNAEEPKPGPTLLLGEGDQFLASFGSRLDLYEDDNNETRKLWSVDCPGRIMITHMEPQPHPHSPKPTDVLVVNDLGVAFAVSLENGRKRELFNIDKGVLDQLILTRAGLLYATATGEIGLFSTKKQATVGSYTGLSGEEMTLFAWQPSTPLIVVGNQFFQLDMRARKPRPQHLSLKGFDGNSPVTFTGRSRTGDYLYLGFEDGTVVICSASKGDPVFHLTPANGPITGFHLLHQLTAAVACTGRGKLTFWDLRTGTVLEELSAHRGSVLSLRCSETGRYLLTAGTDNQIRLWETSWTASEEEGEPELEWMYPRKKVTKLGRLFGFGAR
jgi:WD40 repeat protein